MKNLIFKRVLWLLIPLLTLISTNAWGDDVCYTLTPTNGSNNSYTGNCDVDVTDDDNDLTVTWNLLGNSQTTCWRVGGKKLTSATTRTLYSKTTAIPDNVTKIEIDLGGISSQLTCSKCSLVVSTAANGGGTQTSNLSITSGISANGTLTFTRPDGKNWAGKYYKFMFVVTTDNTNTNRYLEICEMRFYKASAGTSVSLTKAATSNGSFTLSSDGPLNTATAQTITVTGTPNTGYYLSSVTQSGASSTPTITKTSATTYTIQYPASCTGTSTITATFSPIWQLRGTFNSWAADKPMTTIEGTGASAVASISLDLAANTQYQFQFYDASQSTDAAAYHGNNGCIVEDISGWGFATGSPSPNAKLFTGKAGSYTFKINLSTKNVQVIYPTVTDHPNSSYLYFKKWNDWDNYYVHWWYTDGEGDHALTTWGYDINVTKEATICGTTYRYFPYLTDYPKLIVKEAVGDATDKTGDLVSSSSDGGKYFDFTNDGAWNTFTTYTITFAGNGNTGGSMSNVSSICPSSDVVLASNGYTKTDYDFAGWKTNTAVTINGSTPVAVNGIIPNGATINSVSSNITLTAQWQRDEDQFIDILQNTSGYTEASPHIEFGSYSTPSLSDKAVATSGTCQQQHYHFVGWITAAKYAAGTAISDGDLQTPTTASNATYYAVWAKGSSSGGSDYELVTSSSTALADGDEIIIATSGSAGSAYVMGYQKSNNRDVVSVTIASGPKISSPTLATLNTDQTNIYPLQLEADGDYFRIIDKVNNDYLAALGGTSNNYLKLYGGSSTTGARQFTISVDASGVATIKANITGSNKRDWMRYNSGSPSVFACYNSGQNDIYIYRKPGVTYTDYKAICCTDWSTPTVTYTSPLAIGGTASVSIGSGTTHGAVTYESSDEDVLTVAADGTVTAVGAGTAHVIATWAGDATYCEKSANSNDISVSGILVTGTTPVNFGQVYQNAVVANKTISVTGVNLASAITPSLPAGSPFSFSPASLAANSSGATLTISASTATLGNYNQTLTLTSGAFSTTVTVKMEVIAMPSCEFVDNLHNLTVDASSVTLSSYNLTAAQGTAVVFPTLANQTKGASTCEDQHYRFVGWTTSDNNTDPEDHLVTSHTLANGDDITYYAVWADGVEGVTYTKLTSSTFKTSPTKYVLGAVHPDNGTIYYLYSCSQTDKNNSWGYCSSDPSEDAPIQFTLSGSAAALVATSTEVTSRYLKDLADKDFQLSASSKDVELKSDGTIYNNNTGETSYRLLFNKAGSGLRWYSSNVSGSSNAFFYEVGAGSVVHYRTSCCANKVEAPTVTATKTSTSITLTWGDETGATGWEVSWNGGAFGSPSGTRTHTVSGLTPNTTYTWQVRATYDPLVKCGADIASGSTTTNQVYHVTYAKGDGEANCSATGTTTDATGYEAGATVTLQANGFTLVGHIFAGWTEDDDDITISSNQFTMPDHDVVITASWTAKVDKYFDRMHDQTDALHGGVEETEGTNEGKYYIAKTGCNYSIPTAVDSNTGDACQTSHYKLQGWIASSYVASDGTITPANLSAHLFPPSGTKTATGATYYAVWAEVTE